MGHRAVSSSRNFDRPTRGLSKYAASGDNQRINYQIEIDESVIDAAYKFYRDLLIFIFFMSLWDD